MTSRRRTSRRLRKNGPAPIDPRKAIIYFDLTFEEYDAEEDAADGNKLAKKILSDDGETLRKLESDAIDALSSKFGVKIYNEGTSYFHDLICKFGVNSWADVDRVNKTISRNHIGGDDQIETGVPYFTAQGFTLYPQGVNGPRYGTVQQGKADGDLDEWLDEHK